MTDEHKDDIYEIQLVNEREKVRESEPFRSLLYHPTTTIGDEYENYYLSLSQKEARQLMHPLPLSSSSSIPSSSSSSLLRRSVVKRYLTTKQDTVPIVSYLLPILAILFSITLMNGWL